MREGFLIVIIGLFIVIPVTFAFYGTQVLMDVSLTGLMMALFMISVIVGILSYFVIHLNDLE